MVGSTLPTFEPRGDEQREVIESTAPLTVVLGGAGTGKTTSALAAAQAHLVREGAAPGERVLFLSFSRASVARIIDRGSGVLGKQRDQVDVMTFHALAFSIVRRFGSLLDLPDPVLVSPPRQRLGAPDGSIGYDQLIPLALKILKGSEAVREFVQARWSLVIVDEFQDCADLQQDLLDVIAGDARQMFLGDPNQCIYTWLDGVRLDRITDASTRAGADGTIVLPEASHRDPTGVIPSVASAVQRRDFGSDAISTAIDSGRLVIRSGISLADEVETVRATVEALRDESLGVAVFTHHNDMLAALSDGLERSNLDHEIAGLSDALSCALDAQVQMIRYGDDGGDWAVVLDALAVFITSAQRGKTVPQLAYDVLQGTGAASLQERIAAVRATLDAASTIDEFVAIAAGLHDAIGLPSKSNAWTEASRLLLPMAARARRVLGPGATNAQVLNHLAKAAREVGYTVLTDVAVSPRDIQLMNLYQTKGREADATIVVLREGDFMGNETEPFPNTSRLLYVVFSRARERIVVLLIGRDLPAAVAPFGRLAEMS